MHLLVSHSKESFRQRKFWVQKIIPLISLTAVQLGTHTAPISQAASR